MTKSYQSNGSSTTPQKSLPNTIPLDKCNEKQCQEAIELRDNALKRLKEMTVFKASRKKKYIESCAMLEQAGNILYTCRTLNNGAVLYDLTNSINSRNHSHSRSHNNNHTVKPSHQSTTHCHCADAGDCYNRAALVYYDKLHTPDSAYHCYLISARCYAECINQPNLTQAYYQLLKADHSRKEAGLTDRQLHIDLAILLRYVSNGLWDNGVKLKSITALEISLSCFTRALVSHWSSDMSDQLHSVRVDLADKHVNAAMLGENHRDPNSCDLTTNSITSADKQSNDTALHNITPRQYKDHWSRAKELYEQAARFFPGRYLLRREIAKVFLMHKNDVVCELIAAYAVERNSIVACLFRASLCDLVISNRDHTLPDRALLMPRILQRYCMVSRSFTASPECKLIRALSGLIHLSTICPTTIQGPARNHIINLWNNELVSELDRVVDVYTKQVKPSVIDVSLFAFIRQCISWNVEDSK